MVSSRKTKITKNNKMMAFVELEDLYGSTELVVFPKVYERCASLLEEGSIVAVTGSVNMKEEKAAAILADSVKDLRAVAAEAALSTVYLRITPEAAAGDSKAALDKVCDILRRHRGEHPVNIYMPDGKGMRAPRDLWAEPSDAFRSEIEGLLGPENIKF